MAGRNFIAGRPDQAIRVAFFAAWSLGIVAIFGATATKSLLVLMLPAGILITACGILMGTNWHGARDRLTARYRNTWQFRLSGKSHFTRFEGVLLAVIGLAWTAMGIAQFVKLIG